MADRLNDLADSVVVIGHLEGVGPESRDSGTGAAEVIMWQAKQREVRQAVSRHVPQPLVVQIRVRVVHVKTAVIDIRLIPEPWRERHSLRNIRRKGGGGDR